MRGVEGTLDGVLHGHHMHERGGKRHVLGRDVKENMTRDYKRFTHAMERGAVLSFVLLAVGRQVTTGEQRERGLGESQSGGEN